MFYFRQQILDEAMLLVEESANDLFQFQLKDITQII